MAVRLEFETTDSQEIELAKRYWAMDEEGAYLERVADLLPFREITQASMVAKFVRQICTAYDENQTCPKCDGQIQIGGRTEAKKVIQRSNQPCEECQKIQDEERQKEEAQQRAELDAKLALTSPVHGKRPFPTLRYLTTLYSSCKQSMHWSALCLRKGPFRWTTVKR